MKTKHLIYAIPFLITLGTIAFWVVQIEAQTTTDSWEAWVDEQTDTVFAGSLSNASIFLAIFSGVG